MAGGAESVVMVEDKLRDLDRSLGMNKMAESITSQRSNGENKAVMWVRKVLGVIFFPLPNCL